MMSVINFTHGNAWFVMQMQQTAQRPALALKNGHVVFQPQQLTSLNRLLKMDIRVVMSRMLVNQTKTN